MPGTGAVSTVISSHSPAFVFTFSSFTGRVTSAEITNTGATIDVSHLGLDKWDGEVDDNGKPIKNCVRLYRKAPIIDSPELKLDFIADGNAKLPLVGWKDSFTLTMNGASLAKASICTKAICTSASVKVAVGEIVKGSATFKLMKEST